MIERGPSPVPFRRSPSRARRWLLIGLGILFVVLLSLRGIATFWTDYLWFDSVGFAPVWKTLIFTRVLLVVVATIVAFALMFLNLVVADRLAPALSLAAGSPDEELIERFQAWVSDRVLRFRLAVSGFFGLLIGLGAGAWWEDLLLFRNQQDFGIQDPVFSRDIGFYVFDVPFYRDLFGWAFQFVLITTLVVAAMHYLNGGIQVTPGRQRVASGVKVHLSVLLAIMAILKAVGYWLDRFDLLYSDRGAVFGATYTDVNAQLPALQFLFWISLFFAVLLLINIRLKGWTLPLVALGGWLAVSIIAGGVIPAAVQRFSVQPNEIDRELPYVERNILFTRQAYGLETVEVRDFAAASDLDSGGIAANSQTIDNVRLWDPTVLLTTYRQLQELRPFYQFLDVDVDRYPLDGGVTQVMLSTRELDEDSLPGAGWVNRHLVYTHGFGTVVSPANNVTIEGQPDFLIKDINPDENVPAELEIAQNRIYFGEAFEPDTFAIVGTNEQEVDFPIETGNDTVAFNHYDGAGGITVGNVFQRAAFALRFADVNTLISGEVRSDSKVLLVRNVRERLTKAAPFLHPDNDPYLVVLDGRLVWVQDMFTVTDRYPYSTPADDPAATTRDVEATGRLNVNSGLPSEFNYVRNSVKATVDAYDGTIRFYVFDEEDPLIRAYREIFPALFSTRDEMPAGLLQHLRYPEDLFRVQSDIYTKYHVTDSRVFYNNGDPWEIARDPSTTAAENLRESFPSDNRPMVPYYLLMQLPDEEGLSYLMLQPFTAATRPNMVSFLIAKSDADEYGDLIDFELPRDVFVDGPGQVGARINQNPEISREFTLLDQQGSDVLQGNMLVVPIEESILYIQPIYLSARTEAGSEIAALPEFKFVIVVFGNKIVMRETLDEALAGVFGDAPVVDPGNGDGGELPPDLTQAVTELLNRANQAFQRAEQALRSADLATYQAEVAEAQRLIEQARQLLESALESAGVGVTIR
ncbi:MAG TPA: UPF0182 family protein [Acidimicrobiia bacterium]|nr:UPF0182 family protein [Acidimicrobiia bacterium]